MAGEHAQMEESSKKQLASSRRTLVLMLYPCKAQAGGAFVRRRAGEVNASRGQRSAKHLSPSDVRPHT
jgi:hypothetical protein